LSILTLVAVAGGAGIASRALSEPPAAVISGALAQDAAQDNSTAPSISGNWQISFAGKKGNRQVTMEIKQDGSKLSGAFQGERGSAPLTGSLSGNQISLTVKMPRRQISFTGTVDGGKMSGTMEQGGSWSATRQ
jgi:hypothetical protein